MRLTNSQSRSSPIAVAREAVARYAACVFRPKDVVEVRRLPCGRSSWYRANELHEATQGFMYENQHGQHIYVGANPRRVWGGTRSKDVACARCLFVDFDGIGSDTARGRWCDAGLPAPTLTIASGHGVHAYWRLAEPITDMSFWTRCQKRLIALVGSDAAIHDPARLMRLPGFLNHKEPVASCCIIDGDPVSIYELKSLRPLVRTTIREFSNRPLRAPDGPRIRPKTQFRNNVCDVKTAGLEAAKWRGVSAGGRNCKAFQNAAYLVKNVGLTEEQAWPILQDWNSKNRPPLPLRELRQALRNAGMYGRHSTGNKAVG